MDLNLYRVFAAIYRTQNLTRAAEQLHLSQSAVSHALARLRLAGVLVEEKAYDDALAQLSQRFPPEFAGAVADRKGDVLALQGKKQEAIAEYQRAYQAFGDGVEYRRLVEAKLTALGAAPAASAASGAAP